MSMLKPEIRDSIIKQINEGNSINKISKSLDLRKSTIYHYYKKIKGRKFKLVKIPTDDKIIGEFLGVFAGDGNFFFEKNIGHYSITIYLHAIDDKEYGFYLKRLIEENFNKKVRIYFKKRNELKLAFYSKDIYKLIDEYLTISGNKTLNVSLKKPISSLTQGFLSHFVRGLIDTDGHVDKYGKIILALISKSAILQTSDILKQFGIENRISLRKLRPNEHQLYELRIARKDSLKYLEIIGFSNKRKEKKLCASRDSNSRF